MMATQTATDDLGLFREVGPRAQDERELAELHRVVFMRNGRHQRWYDWAHAGPVPGRRFVLVDPATDTVFLVGDDPAAIPLAPLVDDATGEKRPVRVLLTDAEPAPGMVWNGATFAPMPPTAENVKAEAGRRLAALIGARDRTHAERMIADGTREGLRLMRKGEAAWSSDDLTRAAHLERTDAAVDAIDTASKALRALDPIPDDYADDRHWPAL